MPPVRTLRINEESSLLERVISTTSAEKVIDSKTLRAKLKDSAEFLHAVTIANRPFVLTPPVATASAATYSAASRRNAGRAASVSSTARTVFLLLARSKRSSRLSPTPCNHHSPPQTRFAIDRSSGAIPADGGGSHENAQGLSGRRAEA